MKEYSHGEGASRGVKVVMMLALCAWRTRKVAWGVEADGLLGERRELDFLDGGKGLIPLGREKRRPDFPWLERKSDV